MPARPLYDLQPRGPGYAPKGEVCPQASEAVLRTAREQAVRAEIAGQGAARQTGLVPRGPPSLPTGVVVVEQKYVDFIIGPGGQSLASINYAAGVNVQLDQSNKFSGYTIANIYGTEAAAKQAKVAIEFKISQWLPRGVSYGSMGSAQGSTPSQPSKPVQQIQRAPVSTVDSSATSIQDQSNIGDAEDPPDKALNKPLVQSLAKWPSVVRSAGRSSAAGVSGAAAAWTGPAPNIVGLFSGGVL